MKWMCDFCSVWAFNWTGLNIRSSATIHMVSHVDSWLSVEQFLHFLPFTSAVGIRNFSNMHCFGIGFTIFTKAMYYILSIIFIGAGCSKQSCWSANDNTITFTICWHEQRHNEISGDKLRYAQDSLYCNGDYCTAPSPVELVRMRFLIHYALCIQWKNLGINAPENRVNVLSALV